MLSSLCTLAGVAVWPARSLRSGRLASRYPARMVAKCAALVSAAARALSGEAY